MPSSIETFSDGESFATFIGVAIGLFPFLRWNNSLWQHGLFAHSRMTRFPLILIPFIGLAILEVVLVNYADIAVRSDWRYQGFFLLYGIVWLNSALAISSFFRLSLNQDIIERNNPAAVVGLAGVLASFLIVYGGGNVGSGATVSTTFISTILGTVALTLCWFFIEVIASPVNSVTVDRDLSSAYRLSGALVGIALIFGRAVAGDWVSYEATINDLYLKGWAAIVLVVAAIAMQIRFRPTPENPHPSVIKYGIVPALIVIAGAIVYIAGASRV
jgi:hypothetical protein